MSFDIARTPTLQAVATADEHRLVQDLQQRVKAAARTSAFMMVTSLGRIQDDRKTVADGTLMSAVPCAAPRVGWNSRPAAIVRAMLARYRRPFFAGAGTREARYFPSPCLSHCLPCTCFIRF